MRHHPAILTLGPIRYAGMASAPLATTRIIASEPADSSSTALPPKTALAKPAEPARQEEVAALQQAEIAKALAVEKAELAKVQEI